MGKKEFDKRARAGFDAMVAAAGRDARKLVAVAELAARIALPDRVYPLARQAQAAAPDDPEIRARAQRLIGKPIPRYHARMVRDDARNAAFEAAIGRAVSADTRVLDIGAGSGLLSMMAARAGAKSVVACEMMPAVADAAHVIVAQNDLADRVRIVTGKSTDLYVAEDLGGRADVIVSEILSNNLIGEGVLDSLSDAAERLLAPGGRMIPAGGDIMVALAAWPGLAARRLGEVAGFDLSAFNRIEHRPMAIAADDATLKLRSAPAALFAFDFTRPDATDNRSRVSLTADGGRIDGVVQWIRLRMDDVGGYENPPAPARLRIGASAFIRWPNHANCPPERRSTCTACMTA